MGLLSQFDDGMHVAVIGASGGIGNAFVNHLSHNNNVHRVYAFSRSKVKFEHENVSSYYIDICDEDTIHKAAKKIKQPLSLIVVATGILHESSIRPEKTFRDITLDTLQYIYTINTFGPALVMKHFLPLLPRQGKSVVAALSARVGSISDNVLGGWYAYRSSKAALNMLLKTTSIEIARKYKDAAVIGLHPGTVDTGLSQPFHGHVSHDIFSAGQSVKYLLDVINNVTSKDSGNVFAWDGQKIES